MIIMTNQKLSISQKRIYGLIVPIILIVFGILTFGHIFNFVMSIIGAFVHPARLTFLEFFGRFYEGGGSPFKPFTKNYSSIEIVDLTSNPLQSL